MTLRHLKIGLPQTEGQLDSRPLRRQTGTLLALQVSKAAWRFCSCCCSWGKPRLGCSASCRLACSCKTFNSTCAYTGGRQHSLTGQSGPRLLKNGCLYLGLLCLLSLCEPDEDLWSDEPVCTVFSGGRRAPVSQTLQTSMQRPQAGHMNDVSNCKDGAVNLLRQLECILKVMQTASEESLSSKREGRNRFSGDTAKHLLAGGRLCARRRESQAQRDTFSFKHLPALKTCVLGGARNISVVLLSSICCHRGCACQSQREAAFPHTSGLE